MSSSADTGDDSGGGYLIVYWANDVVKAVSDNGAKNVERTFANIATEMTRAMRMTAGQFATGTATALEPYIHIEWAWLVLPLMVIVAAMAYVAMVGWQTRMLKVRLWKLNALAAILHGLEEREGDARVMVKISEMDEWAKRNRSRLGMDEGNGWGLGTV